MTERDNISPHVRRTIVIRLKNMMLNESRTFHDHDQAIVQNIIYDVIVNQRDKLIRKHLLEVFFTVGGLSPLKKNVPRTLHEYTFFLQASYAQNSLSLFTIFGVELNSSPPWSC